MTQQPNDIYVAWDDDPKLFQITFANAQFVYSRLATLEEVKKYGANSDSFINSIKSNELIKVVEGVFKTYWETEKDPIGFEEKYLYLVEGNNKHLIY